MTDRIAALFCYASALAAIGYMAVSGQHWPLYFVGVMIGFGIIFGVADLLAMRGRKKDDAR